MPRRSSWYDDEDPYGRGWDNWYNQCSCEYYPKDDDEDDYEVVECDYCKREKEQAARTAARAEAKRAAEEARLRATGWYDEITTIRGFINRFQWLTGAQFFDDRVKLFREMFTTLAGYDRFLAAQPKMRKTIGDKLAECRASPRASVELKDVMDQLDAVLARLPTVDGYKAE